MATRLKYIGQSAMDNYYQNYKGNADFFDLPDFIFRAAAFIAEFYQQIYMSKYAELRQEKRHSIDLVSFNSDMLSVEALTVTMDKETREYTATPTARVMTFLYDQSNVGYQNMIPVSPKNVNLERSTIDELWQLQYVPFVGRIFWIPDQGKITFYKKGDCNITKANLYYIPALMNDDGEVYEDAVIADSVANTAISNVPGIMKQIAQGTIVKQTNDMNPNKVMESEINKTALK